MASVQKRKQLVNQLRKAHFPFGYHPTKDIESQYIQKYKQYDLYGNNHQVNENARKNNFQLGDKTAADLPQSEFKQKYPQHQNQYRGRFMPEQSKNIVFGYDGSSYDTNYKDDYIKKNKERNLGNPLDQKKRNIQFGDSLTDFTTTYNQVFDSKQPETKNFNAPSMRRTNLVLGNDSSNYVSQSNAAYQPVPVQKYQAAKGSNASNINLGDDRVGFASQNKAMFAHKEAPYHSVNKEQIRDFRSAHFQFGFPNQNDFNNSEAQAQYTQKAIQLAKAQGSRDSNINLNISDQNYFDTSYNKDFDQKKIERQPIFKTGRVDNVIMGSDSNKGMYESQAKNQFTNKPMASRAQATKHPNNLQLGNLPTDYQTHYRNTHTDKFGQRENSKIDQNGLKKLKDKNFHTGFAGNEYSLSSANYGKQLGAANRLDKQTLDKMRNTNIHAGDENPFAGSSIYKSSFPWKKNDEI